MRSRAFRPVGLPIYVARIPSAPFASRRRDTAAFVRQRPDSGVPRMAGAGSAVIGNLRLVVTVAHDYANLGLPLLDLVSEGNIGLTKAVRKTGLSQRRGNCSAGSQHFSVLHKRERIAPLLREETKVARWRRIVRLLPCARVQDADRSA